MCPLLRHDVSWHMRRRRTCRLHHNHRCSHIVLHSQAACRMAAHSRPCRVACDAAHDVPPLSCISMLMHESAQIQHCAEQHVCAGTCTAPTSHISSGKAARTDSLHHELCPAPWYCWQNVCSCTAACHWCHWGRRPPPWACTCQCTLDPAAPGCR